MRRLWLWAAVVGIAAIAFKPVVENDGVYYFTYLHAVLVNHTLNVASQLPHAYQSTADWFPVGSALLSSPAYLVALVLGSSGRGPFDSSFVYAYVLASLLYGLLAVAISYRLASAVTGSNGSAAIGAVAGALTTPFAYYLLYEPSYSHTFSAFAMAAFLFVWWRSPERGVGGWLALGALGGLMALVRFQDGLLMAIALLDLPKARWRVLLMVPSAALVLLPQVAVDLAQWGTVWPQRAVGQALAPFPGHYLSVLFASHNGLFVWSPSLLIAAVGIALLKDRRLALAALLAFAIETAIDGMLPDWSGGFAFGGRRFVALLPLFIVGFASAAQRARPALSWAVTAAFGLWNALLMANLTYVVLTERDPGYVGLLTGQLQAVRYLAREFVQGQAARDLVLWPVLKVPFQPAEGAALLGAEAVCAAVFVWAMLGRRAVRPAALELAEVQPVLTPSLETSEVPALVE